jgi:hypothetical protein
VPRKPQSGFQLNPPFRVGEISLTADEIPYGDEIAAAAGGFNFI